MGTMAHGRNLRRGCFSEAGRVYLPAMVSIDRAKAFSVFSEARAVVRAMHQPTITSVAETLAFVVMPDHVHWLIRLQDGMTLGEAVRRFKAEARIALGHPGWQRGFHDHALRREEDLFQWCAMSSPTPFARALFGISAISRIGMPCG